MRILVDLPSGPRLMGIDPNDTIAQLKAKVLACTRLLTSDQTSCTDNEK
jgi:hypothetical protein